MLGQSTYLNPLNLHVSLSLPARVWYLSYAYNMKWSLLDGFGASYNELV